MSEMFLLPFSIWNLTFSQSIKLSASYGCGDYFQAFQGQIRYLLTSVVRKPGNICKREKETSHTPVFTTPRLHSIHLRQCGVHTQVCTGSRAVTQHRMPEKREPSSCTDRQSCRAKTQYIIEIDTKTEILKQYASAEVAIRYLRQINVEQMSLFSFSS